MNTAQFSYGELQDLAIILQVDIRVCERLGIETPERSKRLLEKIDRLLLERAKELNLDRGEEK